jgi:hypothetical protein
MLTHFDREANAFDLDLLRMSFLLSDFFLLLVLELSEVQEAADGASYRTKEALESAEKRAQRKLGRARKMEESANDQTAVLA